MNYKETWTFLDNLQFFKIKLGLESMQMFLEELGSPEEEVEVCPCCRDKRQGLGGCNAPHAASQSRI